MFDAKEIEKWSGNWIGQPVFTDEPSRFINGEPVYDNYHETVLNIPVKPTELQSETPLSSWDCYKIEQKRREDAWSKK